MLTIPIALFLINGMTANSKESDKIFLPFIQNDEWNFSGIGKYDGWADQRDLFVIYHPWDVSESGNSGILSRMVPIPEKWEGRVRMHFYMTDDYHGRHSKLDSDNWLGQISFIGHRFKQILVNYEVIWEMDVADPEGVSEPSHFSVLLPENIKAGDDVKIGFRMIDKVGSMERLLDDYRHIGTTEGVVKEEDPWKFMTHLYIGDVTLTPESVKEIENRQPSSALLVEKMHSKNFPMKPYGENIAFPVPLYIETIDDMGSMEYPVQCGIPLPAGIASNVDQIIIRNRSGEALPLQLEPMNYWQDGTIRWVKANTTIKSDDIPLSLNVSKNKNHQKLPTNHILIKNVGENSFEISTGQFGLAVGGKNGTLIAKMQNKNAIITDLRGEIEINGKVYSAMTNSARILSEGPLFSEIELTGKMGSYDSEIGRFIFRLSVMAGQPYVRIFWRIFNDQAETLDISRFEFIGKVNMSEDAISQWNKEQTSKPNVIIRQLSQDKFDVIDDSGNIIDSGQHSEGWLGISDKNKGFIALTRHFYQQFPKAIQFNNGKIRISLFESSEQQAFYQPNEGEAKRHEIWLGLWDKSIAKEEMSEYAMAFSRPIRLSNAEYFCKSGGFGYAEVHNDRQFSDLDNFMKSTYGDISEDKFYQLGIRNWGDQPYQKDKNSWCNGYYDRQQGLASEYIMTGDPRWFDRLEATVRHIMDIDICHASSGRSDLIGAIYDCYATDHNKGNAWDMMQRIRGMLAYWRLTGDIDAKNEALAVADSVIRNDRGIHRGSIRDHGGALYCVMSAYDETLDPKYLDMAKRIAYDSISRVDRRRGTYSEVHGNISYRGNVPWMAAQLAQPLYEYYRFSGDIAIAKAVVGLAESMITENCERSKLGDVYGYSHNPHFGKTSGYHILIAPAILYAYELTGDESFLKHGVAMYKQTIEERTVNSINNCYWNTPTLLYYLKRFGFSSFDDK
jgi:hypothetical protein